MRQRRHDKGPMSRECFARSPSDSNLAIRHHHVLVAMQRCRLSDLYTIKQSRLIAFKTPNRECEYLSNIRLQSKQLNTESVDQATVQRRCVCSSQQASEFIKRTSPTAGRLAQCISSEKRLVNRAIFSQRMRETRIVHICARLEGWQISRLL